MDYQEIDKLLQKYFDGNTSLEEEAVLKNFFSNEKLPKEYLKLKGMFNYFSDSSVKSGKNTVTDNELVSIMQHTWKKETRTKMFRLVLSGSIAAMLAISVGIYYFSYRHAPRPEDTFQDPQQAYAETKKTLLYISNYMNQKTASLKYISEIDRSLKKINKISELNKTVYSLKTGNHEN
jgi:hypothetical protein